MIWDIASQVTPNGQANIPFRGSHSFPHLRFSQCERGFQNSPIVPHGHTVRKDLGSPKDGDPSVRERGMGDPTSVGFCFPDKAYWPMSPNSILGGKTQGNRDGSSRKSNVTLCSLLLVSRRKSNGMADQQAHRPHQPLCQPHTLTSRRQQAELGLANSSLIRVCQAQGGAQEGGVSARQAVIKSLSCRLSALFATSRVECSSHRSCFPGPKWWLGAVRHLPCTP